ncbi:GNAT family N-acetyltransferase [Laribacter hongkongensis]|jgi:N-acetylglutamate synthase-like GNAT family acetyltransferase|uniref:GNAT family N-acetyltransferase n=1 Tax=Laribacter hongkongensis TaxID=168471 RepID=UPI001EFD78C0|nr:GNAT family N-acetyltransferase [Laribacter hongkongensis]MCG9057076.1 GNAT family N-acetyltransferase [Laribacter hongkongensis]
MTLSAAIESLLSRLPPGSVPGLRPQTGDDQAFIRELFVSRRWAEVSAVPGWDDAQRRSFLYSQAELQRKHYEQHYPAAGFLIVEHAGNPIGRLCMHCSATNLHIVDLALLPVWCGQGIGSRLLQVVLAQADSHRQSCTLSVERGSRARWLYERLGFKACGDAGIRTRMRRSAASGAEHQRPIIHIDI